MSLGLGLGTKLGLLGHLLTFIDLHTKLGTNIALFVGWPLLCVVRSCLNKKVVKRALIFNLNIYHALNEITDTTC